MKVEFIDLGDEFDKQLEIVSEPSNHAAQECFAIKIDHINQYEYRSGTTSLITLAENYVTNHHGILFKPFDPFFEVYNEYKGWLESNGIMEKWRRDNLVRKTKPEEIGPQVLTMDHLGIGFSACLIPAIISIAAFILENLWSRVVTALKKYFHKILITHTKIMLKIILIEAFSEFDLDLCETTQSIDEDTVSIDSIDALIEMCVFKSHCKSRLEK